MLIQPIFNRVGGRPYRWALELVYEGDVIEKYWVDTDQYVYAFEKVAELGEEEIGTVHTVQTWYPDEISNSNIRPMRKHHVGFLTTFHRNFGEDTQYVEVLNDPVNYIGEYGESGVGSQAIDYGEAYTQAQQRIGNYRMGARRNILHLGGTFSDDMLDDLSSVEITDFYPRTILSFPFFPPKPVNYVQSARINLLTTDGGYVNYLKSIHPSVNNNETFLGEQGTGFRRIIWAADALTTHATVLTDSDSVDVQDIETVLDAAIGTDLDAGTGITTFLPVSGEDITVNIPGKHIVRSTDVGYTIEIYSDATLATLTSSIAFSTDGATAGDVEITAGNNIIYLDADANLTLTDGTRSITMNGSTVDVT
ncbi:hypothetical protein LCGC14_0368590 [marine sediment metagenome]|uniref:Uncharacterized protein n=1 Tax=marine sediment metagenome TaxID=412755 RepID=A0A0F9TNX3_9ZZZZ